MSGVKVPANLPDLVGVAFQRAKASGDISFFPTQVAVLNINGVPFQLRYSPALANKPKPPPKSGEEGPKEAFNPFENPSTLLITPLPPSHNIVLNKFAISPEHFILSTQTFKDQTHLLEPEDLAATHACVEAYRAAGQDLFVFFNSGPHSGASQPHRHLQLVPVKSMMQGLDESSPWRVLADSLLDQTVSCRLPFQTFAERIGPDTSAAVLHEHYLSLYRRACQAAGESLDERGTATSECGEPAKMSYNLAMTSDVLAICPRTAEGATITDASGTELGFVALNGTVLAGTALVKKAEEWKALKENEEQLKAVLSRIGLSNLKRQSLAM